jgi:hypothetical protein
MPRLWNLAALTALGTLAVSSSGCSSPGGTVIESVTPSSGSPYGGTAIQIIGSGFEATDTVQIGKAQCSSLRHVSDTEIDCVTPPATPGAADVSLIRGGASDASLPGGFTYACVAPAPAGAQIWANEGGDKVPQDDLRATCSPAEVRSGVWDGSTIRVFGARNEVVNFNAIIEAPATGLSGVSVRFDTLTGPGGFSIASVAASGDALFDWTNRNIELFYVRYLKIQGLSRIAYDSYDERQIPARLERPWTGSGDAVQGTGWTDRPDHDKSYPDIAVPLEAVGSFDVAGGKSQSIWADIYIPKTAPPGTYTGAFVVSQAGTALQSIPVQLTVRAMPPLPDVPSAKTMVFMGYEDMGKRYFGVSDLISNPTDGAKLDRIRDRAFMMAHRHKLSLVDKNLTYVPASQAAQDQPQPVWIPRLNGSLFTAANGYDGPGAGVGNGVFSIGVYGSWNFGDTQADMWAHTNSWEQWFEQNAPDTERSLFLEDEAADYAQVQTWRSWMKSNPGAGARLPGMIADNLLAALQNGAAVDIVASLLAVGDSTAWPDAVASLKSAVPGAKFYLYNGKRPASGSFATEDDGVALRELAWGQYKKGVDRWFYWESTYYNNYQGEPNRAESDTNVFEQAQTFGSVQVTRDPSLGLVPQPVAVTQADGTTTQFSEPYGNGDGVLFYPGTDVVYPADSYGLDGPIASLRLKYWRRGIQDVDYLTMAAALNPAKVRQIVLQMVPSVLWEPGLTNPQDPSSSRVAPSWSTHPDDWEAARAALAAIIENGG